MDPKPQLDPTLGFKPNKVHIRLFIEGSLGPGVHLGNAHHACT